LTFLRWDDLNAFDFSVLLEELLELLTSELVGETLDEEVALLLGVLESGLFSLNLSLSLFKRKGWLNVKGITIKGLSVKISDGFISTLGSIELVIILIEADEGEWLFNTFLVKLLHDDARLDLTVLGEEGLYLLRCKCGVEVLNIDVVVYLTGFTGILRLVSDKFETIDLRLLNGLFSIFLLLEANEAVSV